MAVKKSKKRFGCDLFIVKKKRQKVLFKAVKRDAELSAEVNMKKGFLFYQKCYMKG